MSPLIETYIDAANRARHAGHHAAADALILLASRQAEREQETQTERDTEPAPPIDHVPGIDWLPVEDKDPRK